MPLTIRCYSCGFVLYRGSSLKTIDDVLREWGFRCPKCLSPLSKSPEQVEVHVGEDR